MEDALKERIVHFFHQHARTSALILFGSHAKGEALTGSDVDIAVLFEGKSPSPLELIDIRTELEELLGLDVDLVDLATISPILGVQIFKYGQELNVSNRHAFNIYQARLLIDYAELKEMRKPMEEQILKRKYYDRS